MKIRIARKVLNRCNEKRYSFGKVMKAFSRVCKAERHQMSRLHSYTVFILKPTGMIHENI